MPEQMTKQDAIETLENFRNDYTREGSQMCRAIDIVLGALKQPTIEPEVRHGQWEYDDVNDLDYCSECNTGMNGEFPFCPYCGAKMDGGAG